MKDAVPSVVEQQQPRVGFLGVGWIGRSRMLSLLEDGNVEAVAVCDPASDVAAAAAAETGATAVGSLDDILDMAPDGIVVATPSALHAEQAVQAIDAGCAVFCQKPLGRSASEVQRVIDAAKANDVLLATDLSYRHTAAMVAVKEAISAGSAGEVYAADLTFHNAFGPDKPWFLDPQLSGGGCVIDLGIHMVDLVLWLLGGRIETATSRLFAGGQPLVDSGAQVEDFATADLSLSGGASVRLACSWFLHAGRDAVIEADFYGTEGSVGMRNVGGSFYDFIAELRHGTRTTILAEPPDAWGGRAIVEWGRSLARRTGFDGAVTSHIEVARGLDMIYGRDR